MQNNSKPTSTCRNNSVSHGFTLTELLVVIAVIGILAALLLPALSRGKQKAQGVSCTSNGKQMMLAMTMYSHDNSEFFPPNPDDGNTVPGHNWVGGQAGINGDQEFNSDILRDPNRSLLAIYLSKNISVFHCPTDTRTGLYQGSDPQMVGKTVSAARTWSMNQAIGTICPGYDTGMQHSGVPALAVNGPWLNNNRNHRRNSPWLTYAKFSAIQAPSPAKLWVLVDESGKGLNDGAFAFGMEKPIWYDVPGTYHNYGAGFAFADGHTETHQWAMHSEKQGKRFRIKDPLDERDWLWMRERTSAHISGTMPPPYGN